MHMQGDTDRWDWRHISWMFLEDICHYWPQGVRLHIRLRFFPGFLPPLLMLRPVHAQDDTDR